jgi:hypothetical protein
LFALPALVIASVAAFALSETANLGVTRPYSAGPCTRCFGSSVVGLSIDSVMFLAQAIGSLDFPAGQVIGKIWMVLDPRLRGGRLRRGRRRHPSVRRGSLARQGQTAAARR